MKTTKKIRVSSNKKSSHVPPSSKEKLLYDTDFSEWAENQAALLKNKEFENLDLLNLIEEIEDLSKREKQRLISYLENLLMHKLKFEYQPEKRTPSWNASIKEAGFKAQKTLSDNPSLKHNLKSILEDAYFSARLKAVVETNLEEETFPEKCEWTLRDIFPDLEKKYC